MLMRKEVHTPRSTIAVAAVVMAAALPIIVLLSRQEGNASASPVGRPVLSVAVPPAESAAALAPAPDWMGDAADSASMMLVGTLLIGLGQIIRRAA